MAYVKLPQGELWRSKADGSETLQLTFQPLIALGSQWSPDGKQIAFAGRKIGGRPRLYIVSADGGAPQQSLPELEEGSDPTWSPDGNSLLFGLEDSAQHQVIQVLDLKTKQVTVVPGSEGLKEPRWSPDGQHISALAENANKLLLFDSKTAKWTEMAEMDACFQNWSRDAKYVYFVSAGTDPGVFRVAIRDHKLEKVVSLKGFQLGADPPKLSLTQNDEPVLLRELLGGTEIHALSWEAP
jgi:dipeptidyl aminopeptidase/acylaminoacyl peptidase